MKIVSLFSGCGGFDLGFLGEFAFLGRHYKKLDNEIIFACDFESDACAIYAENIGPIHRLDVRLVKDWKMTERCAEADIVIGGPPCQPFSCAGKRQGENDDRDMMPEFVRCISELKPPSFLMENVKELVRGKASKNYFERIVDQLMGLGYRIEWKALNMADFGIPQARERVFVQGRREDIEVPIKWPKQTHAKEPENGYKPWVNVRQALANISIPLHNLKIREIPEKGRTSSFQAGDRRQAADQPFYTITAVDTAGSCHKLHPWFDRRMVMSELKRGMAFPDCFIVPRKSKALGNAVPPVMAWHLAKAIQLD